MYIQRATKIRQCSVKLLFNDKPANDKPDKQSLLKHIGQIFIMIFFFFFSIWKSLFLNILKLLKFLKFLILVWLTLSQDQKKLPYRLSIYMHKHVYVHAFVNTGAQKQSCLFFHFHYRWQSYSYLVIIKF